MYRRSGSGMGPNRSGVFVPLYGERALPRRGRCPKPTTSSEGVTPEQEGTGRKCATLDAPDAQTGELVACAYCEILDSGWCFMICEDGTTAQFTCSEFD